MGAVSSADFGCVRRLEIDAPPRIPVCGIVESGSPISMRHFQRASRWLFLDEKAA
jgi:hypothetical protein